MLNAWDQYITFPGLVLIAVITTDVLVIDGAWYLPGEPAVLGSSPCHLALPVLVTWPSGTKGGGLSKRRFLHSVSERVRALAAWGLGWRGSVPDWDGERDAAEGDARGQVVGPPGR